MSFIAASFCGIIEKEGLPRNLLAHSLVGADSANARATCRRSAYPPGRTPTTAGAVRRSDQYCRALATEGATSAYNVAKIPCLAQLV
jgi:hypothetical protein